MERLTDNTEYCTSWVDCEMQGRCAISRNCYERQLYNKLREYEDLEEQLEKVYGEHDGLLEIVVEALVKYNGEKPRKSRLLTDEDADKYEMYKDLEEQGMLIRLSCKVGDTVYVITSPYNIDDCEENYRQPPKIFECIIESISLYKCGARQYRAFFNNEFVAHYLNDDNFGKTVFLTREEAEAALERMRKDG